MNLSDHTFTAPKNWQRLPDWEGGGPEISVWYSEADHDPVWDDFLLSNRLGQFQQSSAWARVKRLDGWRAARFTVTFGDRVIAGFQILWKTKFRFRVGYVSKGPVLMPAPGYGPTEILRLLKQAVRQLSLIALIVQLPDLAMDFEEPLTTAGFLENRVLGVYSATVVVDLERPFAEVERGFSHDVGRQIRRQQKSNMQVRFGEAADAERFFDLMKQSCAKQKVAPNPSNPESVRAILREFQTPLGAAADSVARCLFAEQNDRTIAGFLLIRFGETLSLWKKGIVSDAGRAQPNRILDWEAMKWGHSAGCKRYDEVGIDRRTAEGLLAGQRRDKVVVKSSDFYKLDFGGQPALLPEAKIWIPSGILRLVYKVFLRLRTVNSAT